MKDQNCAYCMKNELLDKFGYLAFETNCSLVIVFKDQSHKGRMIVAHKNHISEIQYLSDEERNEYLADVAKVAKAIQKYFTDTSEADLAIAVGNYRAIEAWAKDPTLTVESLNKLMDVIELAGQLDKRAPYDKIVTTEYARNAMESLSD